MFLDVSREISLLAGRNTRAEPVLARWSGVVKYGKLNKLKVCPVCGLPISRIQVVHGERGRVKFIAYYAYHEMSLPHRLGVIEYIPLSEIEKKNT